MSNLVFQFEEIFLSALPMDGYEEKYSFIALFLENIYLWKYAGIKTGLFSRVPRDARIIFIGRNYSRFSIGVDRYNYQNRSRLFTKLYHDKRENSLFWTLDHDSISGVPSIFYLEERYYCLLIPCIAI